MGISVRSDLAEVTKALKRETDGKLLRRDLLRAIKASATPGMDRAKSRVRALPSSSRGKRVGGSLRAKVAARIKPQARLSGRYSGLSILAKKRVGLPRGFQNAPQRLNSRRGWRHPVYGSKTWVTQHSGNAGWFDESMLASKDEVRSGVVGVLDDMTKRIASR